MLRQLAGCRALRRSSNKILTAWPGRVAQAPKAGRSRTPSGPAHHVGAFVEKRPFGKDFLHARRARFTTLKWACTKSATCTCCHVYFTFPSHWERKHFKVSECRGTAGAAAEILGDRAHCEHSHGAHSFLYFTLSFGEVPCNYMYTHFNLWHLHTHWQEKAHGVHGGGKSS